MKCISIKIFFIFSLLLSTLFACLPASQIVFAQETDFSITNSQVNIADIDKYNYINIFSNNIIILSTQLNKISVITDNNITSFDSYGTNDGQIAAPKFVKKISGNKIAIYDINRVQIFDTEFNYIKRFAYINDGQLPLALGTVVSMCTDYAGNIYMLDKSNNLVLKLDTANDIIQKITITEQITITDNSRISVNTNGNKIALINVAENNFVFDLTNQNVQNVNNNIYNDVLFDCMDNLFLLKTEDTKTQITKYECNNYTTYLTKEIPQTYNSVDIDIETGKLFLLCDQVYQVQNDQFFANASTEISPVDITTTQAHDTALSICMTKNNAKLYSTCVSFASSVVLNDNTKVVILQKSMPQNKNMSYCLVTQNGNEITGYIESSNLTSISYDLIETEYKTICQNVNIMSYPSQNSGVVKTIENSDQIVTVLGKVGDYIDSNNQNYFEVKIDDKIAYIEQRFLVKTNLVEIQKAETTPIETNQNQFIAMVLTIVCLFVVMLFVCYILYKKSKHQN